jgi:hypothetical protein
LELVLVLDVAFVVNRATFSCHLEDVSKEISAIFLMLVQALEVFRVVVVRVQAG